MQTMASYVMMTKWTMSKRTWTAKEYLGIRYSSHDALLLSLQIQPTPQPPPHPLKLSCQLCYTSKRPMSLQGRRRSSSFQSEGLVYLPWRQLSEASWTNLYLRGPTYLADRSHFSRSCVMVD
jgi:hypothetical protein